MDTKECGFPLPANRAAIGHRHGIALINMAADGALEQSGFEHRFLLALYMENTVDVLGDGLRSHTPLTQRLPKGLLFC